MKYIDSNFLKDKKSYIVQTLLATAVVFIVLLLLDTMSDSTVIASIGASSFIAFTMPHYRVSRPRYMIGGYVVAVIVGFAVYLLQGIPSFSVPHALLGALAVGLSIFIMVVTNTEHPPAAGLALGFVLNQFTPWVVFVVMTGIIAISALKTLLKPYMKDLL